MVETAQPKAATLVQLARGNVVVLSLQHDPRQSLGPRPFDGLLHQGESNARPPKCRLDGEMVHERKVIPGSAELDSPDDPAPAVREEADTGWCAVAIRFARRIDLPVRRDPLTVRLMEKLGTRFDLDEVANEGYSDVDRKFGFCH